MKRVTLDLDQLVEDGELTTAEADRLAGFAVQSRQLQAIINILMIFGAIAVAAGVIALEPSATTGLILALVALGGGAAIYMQPSTEWRVLSHGLIIMGCLGLSGWMGWQAYEHPETMPDWTPQLLSAILFTAAAIFFRQGFLAALSPLAIGALIGSGTAYWHASYALFVEEPTISIFVFSAMAGGLYFLRDKIPPIYEGISTIAARVAFFMLNFAFWVGSLWGDRLLEHWQKPDYKANYDWEAYEAWRNSAINVPEAVFSLGWAALLGGCIWLGTRDHRRFLANTALVFLAIHFYTQLFETLGAEPIILVFAGLSMVGAAVGVARFDNWLRGHTAKA